MTVRLPPAEAPFPVTAPYRATPAPRPLDGPHVVLDDRLPAALARRRERLAHDRGGVLVRDPRRHDDTGLAAALRAAHDLLPPDCAAPDGDDPLLGAGVERLAVAWALACADDLVVLRRTGPGTLAAELLLVAFPSGWPPRERAGASLLELHAPVADGERLQRAAPALSEALLTKGPYVQHVWGLDPDGRLDRDPSAPDAADGPLPDDPAQWWLRVERQTTLPLPALDRALFVISPFLVPLTALAPGRCAVLADAVASMTARALAYKGIATRADALVAWLRDRAQLSVGSSG